MKKYFWLGVLFPTVFLSVGFAVLLFSYDYPWLIYVVLGALGLAFLIHFYRKLWNDPEPFARAVEDDEAAPPPGMTSFVHGIAMGVLVVIVLMFVVPIAVVTFTEWGLPAWPY